MASITPSPTFSDEFDPWQEIDRITEQYRVAIQNEVKYIYESTFDVNNSMYKLITGFSAARNHVPAVKVSSSITEIVDKTNHISFNEEEWCDFITYLKQFCANYFNTDSDSGFEEEIQFSNYSITKAPIMGNKMLKVTNGFAALYLTENTVREFINMNRLITPHMNVLHSLDFAKFYNNFLNVTNNIICESNYELSSDNVMSYLCDLSPCVQMYCIRECLFFNKNEVLNDLDRKMFILNA